MQLGKCHGPQDQGDLLLRHNRDVNDHEELQLRKLQFSAGDDFLNEQELWEDDCLIHNLPVRTCTTRTTGKSATVSMNWGISMVFGATWTMEISLCAKTGGVDDLR